jgi:hypothetical protein
VIEFPELAEGVQAPSITFPDQAKNGREVVGENDETEPTAVNQPSGLENLFFLLDDVGTAFRAGWDGIRVLPRSALVDLQKFLCYILDEMSNELDQKLGTGNRGRIRCGCG